jgi:hypothetical protein
MIAPAFSLAWAMAELSECQADLKKQKNGGQKNSD